MTAKIPAAIALLLLLNGARDRMPAQELPVTHYTTGSELHPLPSTTVYNMMQDRTGYLWLCVYGSGMVRYDGQQMELWTPADGLSGSTVMCAAQDPAGRLWVASDMGLSVSEEPLESYAPGRRIRFTTTIGGAPLAQTSISQVAPNCLVIDRAGTVYVGTTGLGVMRYRSANGGMWEADTLPTVLPGAPGNRTVYVVHASYDGGIWAGVEGGLMRLDRTTDTFRQYSPESGVPLSNIHALAELSDGSLWGGCENGLVWKLDRSGGRRRITAVMSRMTGIVYGLLEYPRGTVWVASHNSGVMTLDLNDPSVNELFTRRNGLLGNNVRGVMADREGNIWIPQTGGITKLRSNFRAFTYLTANAPSGTSALLPVPEALGIDPPTQRHSTLWACTGAGLVGIADDGRTSVLGVEQGLSSNTTYDVHVDSRYRVWIGTFNGLNCLAFDPKKIPPLYSGSLKRVVVNGTPGVLAYYGIGITGVCNAMAMRRDSAAADTVEAVWFNSYRRVVCLAGGEWFVFDEASGLPASIMYALTTDSIGYVYVGTGDRGLYRSRVPLTLAALRIMTTGGTGAGLAGREIRQQIFEPYWTTASGAPTNEIQELIWHDGTLWVGTVGAVEALPGGVPPRAVSVPPPPGDTTVGGYCGTYNSVTKTLWFAFIKGLTEIDPATHRVIRTVTKDDGLLSNETNWLDGIGTDASGAVYMSHTTGITVYHPDRDRRNELPPPLVIRSLRYDQDPWGHNELQITVAGLSFANERLVRYRTRLTGYDADWSASTAQSQYHYMNLGAFFTDKTYTFEFTACNNAGVWNETPVRYAFIVSPPLWLRWWAFGVYALIVAGLIRAGRWLAENFRIILAGRRARFISHYRLHELLGEGGMGKVYRAVDLHTRTEVAVKVLNAGLLHDPANRRRLSSEGQVLASFNDPHIVRVFEVGETEENGFIVMEYLSGGTLRELLERQHPLPPAEVRRIALQICRGLAAVHGRGVVHRDLKTGNIMLDAAGNIRIMDFGLSKSPLVTTMTSLGTVLGTLGYVAPEQITNQQVDGRTDIFSFGVLLYELLTKTLPFRGENEIALIHSIFTVQPPPPSTLRPDVPAAFDDLVARCLEKNPEERIASAEEVALWLERIPV